MLARKASIKSMTLPPLVETGPSAIETSLPSTFLVLIDILVRVESLCAQLIYELAREFQFGLRHRRRLNPQVFDAANLRLEMQLVHRESVIQRPNDDDVLLTPGDPAPNGALLRFAQRGGQQCIRLGTPFVRGQIVRAVKIKRIHRVERNELADIDGVCRRVLECFQFLGAEHDVLVLGELVSLDHLRAFDRLPVIDGHVLLLDA
jgi:hypothetical protein